MRRRAYTLLILPLLTAACAAPAPPPRIRTGAPPLASAVSADNPSADNHKEPILAPGAVNPDVTQQNIAFTICEPGWAAHIRPPTRFTNRMKLEQMPLYGYPTGTNPKSLKEDHREPLELGGAPRDPKNLWPQPRGEAQAKDRLETATKREVCAGRMTLAQAQAIFFGDFWNYYDRRYETR